jgi:hypothetical protein
MTRPDPMYMPLTDVPRFCGRAVGAGRKQQISGLELAVRVDGSSGVDLLERGPGSEVPAAS